MPLLHRHLAHRPLSRLDVPSMLLTHYWSTTARAEAGIRQLEEWGRENAVTFDPGKTDIMHFSHRLDNHRPTVTHGGRVVAPDEKAMRWLGIWLDRKLTFKTHVERWAAKAKRVAGCLRAMANTHHGAPPNLVHKAVAACVEPTLYHGAEIWYPGTLCPARKNESKMVSIGITSHLATLDKTPRWLRDTGGSTKWKSSMLRHWRHYTDYELP